MIEWASEEDRASYERDMMLLGTAARKIVGLKAYYVSADAIYAQPDGNGFYWLDDCPTPSTRA
jgi:hypothetical protein